MKIFLSVILLVLVSVNSDYSREFSYGLKTDLELRSVSQPIVPGKEYRINAYHTHKYLAVEDSLDTDGTDIVQVQLGESDSDIWTFGKDSVGNWYIINVKTQKILTIDNALHDEGASAEIWYDIGTNAPDQRWLIDEYTSHRPNAYQFRAMHSKKCLSSGSHVISQSKCQDIEKGNEQVFYLFPVGENEIDSGSVQHITPQSSITVDTPVGYRWVIQGFTESIIGSSLIQYIHQNDETDSWELFEEEDGFWTIWYSASHLSLGIGDHDETFGLKVVQAEDDGSLSYRWKIEQIETGYFAIKNRDNGRCLTSISILGHSEMILIECSYVPTQLFRFHESETAAYYPRPIVAFNVDSVHQFEIVESHKLLDIEGAANDISGHFENNIGIVQYTRHEEIVHLHDSAQLWEFVEDDNGGYTIYNVYTNKILYGIDEFDARIVQWDEGNYGGRNYKIVEILPHQFHIVHEHGKCFALQSRSSNDNIPIVLHECGDVRTDQLFRIQSRGTYKDIYPGAFYYIEVYESSLYVDINGAKENSDLHNENGNYLVQTAHHKDAEHKNDISQQWSFEALSDGTFSIHSRYNGRVIFVNQWHIQIGSHIYVENNVDSDNKKWEMHEIKPSVFQIYHRRVQKCIAIKDDSQNENEMLILQDCDESDISTYFTLREIAEEEEEEQQQQQQVGKSQETVANIDFSAFNSQTDTTKQSVYHFSFVNAEDNFGSDKTTSIALQWDAYNRDISGSLDSGTLITPSELGYEASGIINTNEEIHYIQIKPSEEKAWFGHVTFEGKDHVDICLSGIENGCEPSNKCKYTEYQSAFYPLTKDVQDVYGDNHGILYGEGTFLGDGEGYEFSGDNNYIEVDNKWGEDMSISMWIKSTQENSPDNGIFCYDGYGLVSASKSADFSHDYLLSVREGTVCWYNGYPKHHLYSYSAIKVNDGQWHHILVTRKMGGNHKIYVDGNYEAKGDSTNNPLTDNEKVQIGGDLEKLKFFKGQIRDFQIFAAELSTYDVDQVYKDQCAMWRTKRQKGTMHCDVIPDDPFTYCY